MSSNLVAFIIGYGPNIGTSVSAKLRENGYKVAIGSRNPKADKDEGVLPVQVDAKDRDSVLKAFDTVAKTLGPVNVVLYNAASYKAAPVDGELLSIPVDEFFKEATLGLNVFTAAQAALPGFRDPIHKDHPKAFIATGNALPYLPLNVLPALPGHSPANFYTLGLQKVVEARFIATAANSYEKEKIWFYFASLFAKDGGIPDHATEFAKSGPIHATVLWDLINQEKQGDWSVKFALDGTILPNNF